MMLLNKDASKSRPCNLTWQNMILPGKTCTNLTPCVGDLLTVPKLDAQKIKYLYKLPRYLDGFFLK